VQQLDEGARFDHDRPGERRRAGQRKVTEILLHHAIVPTGAEADFEAAWAGFASGPVATRLARLRDPDARRATLLGLALLCDCASAAGIRAPAAGDLLFPPGGKPRWPGGPGFSIAHAAGRAACALAPPGSEVGLDLEAEHDVSPQDLRLVADARELAQYAAAGLGAAALWTAKEAVSKAAGTGLPSLSRVEAGCTEACLDGRRWRLLRPTLAPGLRCTVATDCDARVVVTEVTATGIRPQAG
jgi:4'-phosphopantetheinyl transferase